MVAAALALGMTALPAGVTLAADGWAGLQLAQVDCGAAARRAAARTGGRVLAARPDGRGACEVTLLVPQGEGRPRRVVLTVPA